MAEEKKKTLVALADKLIYEVTHVPHQGRLRDYCQQCGSHLYPPGREHNLPSKRVEGKYVREVPKRQGHADYCQVWHLIRASTTKQLERTARAAAIALTDVKYGDWCIVCGVEYDHKAGEFPHEDDCAAKLIIDREYVVTEITKSKPDRDREGFLLISSNIHREQRILFGPYESANDAEDAAKVAKQLHASKAWFAFQPYERWHLERLEDFAQFEEDGLIYPPEALRTTVVAPADLRQAFLKSDDRFIGHRIIAIMLMDDEEAEICFFHEPVDPVPILVLDNGVMIYASDGVESNHAGALCFDDPKTNTCGQIIMRREKK